MVNGSVRALWVACRCLYVCSAPAWASVSLSCRRLTPTLCILLLRQCEQATQLPSFMTSATPASQNEAWARLNNDPLLLVRCGICETCCHVTCTSAFACWVSRNQNAAFHNLTSYFFNDVWLSHCGCCRSRRGSKTNSRR